MSPHTSTDDFATESEQDETVRFLAQPYRWPLDSRSKRWISWKDSLTYLAILALPPIVLSLHLILYAHLRNGGNKQALEKPYINYRGIEPPNPTQWIGLDCGETASDALAKGCIWEPREKGWISSRCINPEGVRYWEEIDESMGTLDWYWDEDGKNNVNREQLINISSLDHGKQHSPVYMTWRNRWRHCDYSFRTLAMALGEATSGVPERMFDEAASVDCVDILAGNVVRPWDSMVEEIFGFRNCFIERT